MPNEVDPYPEWFELGHHCMSLGAALQRILDNSRDADCGDHCSNSCMYCQGRDVLRAYADWLGRSKPNCGARVQEAGSSSK